MINYEIAGRTNAMTGQMPLFIEEKVFTKPEQVLGKE